MSKVAMLRFQCWASRSLHIFAARNQRHRKDFGHEFMKDLGG